MTLTEVESARLAAARARQRQEHATDAIGAVANLGSSLFGALCDLGLTAAAAASDDAGDEIGEMKEAMRTRSKENEQRSRLALFTTELAVLGLDADAYACGTLDETSLRRAFRARTRDLHPDVRAAEDGAGEVAEEDAEGAELTIYDLNRAYEAVKQMLVD